MTFILSYARAYWRHCCLFWSSEAKQGKTIFMTWTRRNGVLAVNDVAMFLTTEAVGSFFVNAQWIRFAHIKKSVSSQDSRSEREMCKCTGHVNEGFLSKRGVSDRIPSFPCDFLFLVEGLEVCSSESCQYVSWQEKGKHKADRAGHKNWCAFCMPHKSHLFIRQWNICTAWALYIEMWRVRTSQSVSRTYVASYTWSILVLLVFTWVSEFSTIIPVFAHNEFYPKAVSVSMLNLTSSSHSSLSN